MKTWFRSTFGAAMAFAILVAASQAFAQTGNVNFRCPLKPVELETIFGELNAAIILLNGGATLGICFNKAFDVRICDTPDPDDACKSGDRSQLAQNIVSIVKTGDPCLSYFSYEAGEPVLRSICY